MCIIAIKPAGIHMPAIAVRELDGSVRLVRDFSYDDYVSSLS